jgi:hypothetical protein
MVGHVNAKPILAPPTATTTTTKERTMTMMMTRGKHATINYNKQIKII